MPGRGAGAWPQVPSGRGAGADLGTGIGGRGGQSGSADADDLGIDGGDEADLGIGADAERSGLSPDAARASRPAGGTNGRTRPPAAKPEAREARFGRGQRVKHRDYGAGTVIASSVLGTEELVLVRFDSRPDKPKNLSLSVHRLELA
jgi:hypothetical protein